MTSYCREWTQPDGDHFHGLCVNEMMPKLGASSNETPSGCNVCVNPYRSPTPCDLYVPGGPPALSEWYGNYFLPPIADYSTGHSDPANWINTWHPFFRVTIPSGLFAACDQAGDNSWNAACFCPAQYNGVFLLFSADRCTRWRQVDPDSGQYLNGLYGNCSTTTSAPRMEIYSPRPGNVSPVYESGTKQIELHISFRPPTATRDLLIRMRGPSQASILKFNMNETIEMRSFRNAISGNPWIGIGDPPVTIEMIDSPLDL